VYVAYVCHIINQSGQKESTAMQNSIDVRYISSNCFNIYTTVWRL